MAATGVDEKDLARLIVEGSGRLDQLDQGDQDVRGNSDASTAVETAKLAAVKNCPKYLLLLRPIWFEAIYPQHQVVY